MISVGYAALALAAVAALFGRRCARYFRSPLVTLFAAFGRRAPQLEGVTDRDRCRVALDSVALEIVFRFPRDLRVAVGAPPLELTELTLWERLRALLLLRALHRRSRRNSRAEETAAVARLAGKNAR